MKQVIGLIAALFLLQACKKDAGYQPCKVSKIVGVNSLSMYGHPDSSIITMEYSNNRVGKSVETVNAGRTYATVTEKTFDYEGDRLAKVSAKTSNGYQYNLMISYDPNNNISAIDYSSGQRSTYFYTNGKLTKISYRHVTNNTGLGEHDIDFTYSGDNVVKVVESWMGTSNTTTWLISYTDKPNTHFKDRFFTDYFAFPDYYTLAYALSENLVATVESSVGGKSNFSYSFSNTGRVASVTETFTSSVNGYTKKANYEYSCQ